MNFSNIVNTDETLAASLGGLTNGVSPLEMAKAYATIENDGAYRDPTCIARITKADGTKVWENDHEESVVYSQDSAREMTQILEGVFTTSWGTARGLKLGSMPCAGKTGTTNDYKDGWFCGFTSYYTTAIWVGNDQPVTIYGLQGASYPGHIWQNFMLKVNEGKEPKEFPKPVEIKGEIREDISDEDAEKAEKELNSETNSDATTDSSSTTTDNSNTNSGTTDNSGNNSNSGNNNSGNNNSGNSNSGNNNSGNNNSDKNTDNSSDSDNDNSDEPATPPVDERDDSE